MTKNNLIKLLVGKKYIFLGERNFWSIFWSFWGQNTKTFKHGGFIYQNEALEPKIPKTVFSWSLEVTLSTNGVIRGHFGSKSVDFQTYGFYISKWSSWATDCEKVLPKVIRGHTNLKSGSFAVIWGQTLWIFKYGVYISKWSSGASDFEKLNLKVTRGHLNPNLGHLRSLLVTIRTNSSKARNLRDLDQLIT